MLLPAHQRDRMQDAETVRIVSALEDMPEDGGAGLSCPPSPEQRASPTKTGLDFAHAMFPLDIALLMGKFDVHLHTVSHAYAM